MKIIQVWRKAFLSHLESFNSKINLSKRNTFVLKSFTHSVYSKKNIKWIHWMVLIKVFINSPYWNKYDSKLNRTIVAFQLSQVWSVTDRTSHLPRACLMLALEGFPSSLWVYHSDVLAKITRILRRTSYNIFMYFIKYENTIKWR